MQSNRLSFISFLSVLLLATLPALAIPGWNVVLQDNFGEGGIGATVDNINEGETLLALGGAPEATDTPATINYLGTGGDGAFGSNLPFPGGFNGTDDFAVSASGYVTGITGPGSGAFILAVNSDDGFRVRRNGEVIGEFTAPRAHTVTEFAAQLTNGDKIEVNYFERGGGEGLEFYQRMPATTGLELELIGASSSLFQIDNAPTASSTPLILGFKGEVYNAAGAGVFGNGDALVDNVNEAEALIALGGVNGTFTPLIINNPAFPGANADDFAVRLTGFVEIVDGKSEDVFLYVNSDDGFRLRVNGVVVSEFVGLTGGSNVLSSLITLSDGDFIDLTYFERGGGASLQFARDFDGLLSTATDRSFVGLTDSGILIHDMVIPEPTTASLALLGLGGLMMRRRRMA